VVALLHGDQDEHEEDGERESIISKPTMIEAAASRRRIGSC
jgi:hypothetical protein